jgi:hypothetical protein
MQLRAQKDQGKQEGEKRQVTHTPNHHIGMTELRAERLRGQ